MTSAHFLRRTNYVDRFVLRCVRRIVEIVEANVFDTFANDSHNHVVRLFSWALVLTVSGLQSVEAHSASLAFDLIDANAGPLIGRYGAYLKIPLEDDHGTTRQDLEVRSAIYGRERWRSFALNSNF